MDLIAGVTAELKVERLSKDEARVTNGLIAFADAPGIPASPRAQGQARLYTIHPDGSNRQGLLVARGNTFPAFSPDGKQMAFTHTGGRGVEIRIIDSDGKNEWPLVRGMLPAWSPDGKHIAFVMPDSQRRPQIWLKNTNGLPISRQLTTDGHNKVPTFSPDGKRIAYWSGDAHGCGQIWVMNFDGFDPHQLTFPLINDYTPNGSSANAPAWLWSERIAFWRGQEHSHGNIRTMNPDGGDKRQLTTELAPASSDDPVWSPDGRQILFSTQRNQRPELWVMDADGSNQHMLVTGISVLPIRSSWQPVLRP